MNIIDELTKHGKINLFFGDYLIKKANLPSRIDILNSLLENMSEEKVLQLKNKNSLFEVSQTYIDAIISSKSDLLKKIKQNYDNQGNFHEITKVFSYIDRINAIFSINYDTILDEMSTNKIQKILPNKIQEKNEEVEEVECIKHYKILGDSNDINTMFLSQQDFRRLKTLEIYKNFIEEIKLEMKKYPTVILGLDFFNEDLLTVLELFLPLEDEEIKVYAVSDSNLIKTELNKKINELNIHLLPESEKEFYKNLKDAIYPEDKEEEVNVEYDEENNTSLIQEEESNEISEPKIVHINNSDFIKCESALEIQFTSAKIDKIPIQFSTFIHDGKKEIVKTFGIADIKIDSTIVRTCNIKILEIKNKKFIEIKAREFKIGFEVDLKVNGKFTIVPNNYYYTIYKNMNLSRLISCVSTLISIFSGEKIEFLSEYLNGLISFQSNLEIAKLSKLREIFYELKHTKKDKLINEDNSLYAITLLSISDSQKEVETWINFRCNLADVGSINVGDRIQTERIYEIKGSSYDLKETILTLTPISEEEKIDDKIAVYKKPSIITLEKVDKTIKKVKSK